MEVRDYVSVALLGVNLFMPLCPDDWRKLPPDLPSESVPVDVVPFDSVEITASGAIH